MKDIVSLQLTGIINKDLGEIFINAAAPLGFVEWQIEWYLQW